MPIGPEWKCVCCGTAYVTEKGASACEERDAKQPMVETVAVAAENGTLAQLETEMDLEENRPETGDLILDEYPDDEPHVDILDCLADAIGRLSAFCDDDKSKRHTSEMLEIARARVDVLRRTNGVLRDTIGVVEQRLALAEAARKGAA